MNNSKKTLRTQQVKKDVKKVNPKVWMITSIVLVVLLVGAILFDQFYKRVVITINGDKYYMDDLTYYFYGVEAQYDYMDQLYGNAYWDMVVDEETGATYRDYAKEEVISTILYNEILYREAINNNYELTAEETEDINTDVKTMLDDETYVPLVQKNNFTKKYLTEVIGKTTLAKRYRQDVIDSLPIDDEAIKAEINKEDYKQYDIEYLYISTKTTDEEGTTVEMNDEQKKTAYDQLNSYVEKAKQTEDWSTLLPEDESDVKYVENNFVKGDNKFTEDFEETVSALENKEISDILENELGYFLVRMVDNNSQDAYETAVKDAITKAEEDAFAEKYQEILDTYEYEVNDKVMKSLRMGEITLIN